MRGRVVWVLLFPAVIVGGAINGIADGAKLWLYAWKRMGEKPSEAS